MRSDLHVLCPECNGEMVLRQTKKYRHKDGRPRKFFGCKNYPDCKGTHGAHPDGTPLGIPGDAETKIWRMKAHDALNRTYPDMKTKERYRRIQELMELREDDAHIAKFDSDQCKLLVARLEEERHFHQQS